MLFNLKITIQNMLHISDVGVLSLVCFGSKVCSSAMLTFCSRKLKKEKKKCSYSIKFHRPLVTNRFCNVVMFLLMPAKGQNFHPYTNTPKKKKKSNEQMSCKFVKRSTNPFRVRHFMSFAVNPPLAKQLNFVLVNI